MPTTRYLTQIIQDYVNRITGYDGMAPHEGISIPRSTIFNRGNDANGVWSIKMQRDYIDSLMKGYPCGMICLVRDYGNAMSGYNSPSLILDGANKSRALRDFLWDKFTIQFKKEGEEEESPTLFSQLPETVKAAFKTTNLSLCETQIKRGENGAISDMFTRLNTKQVPLSQGELLKAYSWRKDHIIPEFAKNIIGGPIWNRHISEGVTEGSEYETHNVIKENLPLIKRLKRKWAQSPLGVLGESTRLDNLPLLCGMIISMKEKNIHYYDKRFDRLEAHLSDNLTSEQVSEITMLLEVYVEIFTKIYDKSIFGTLKKGMPSRKFASYVMYPLINAEINMEQRRNEIQNSIKYFKHLRSNSEALIKFKGIVSFGGNNENSNSKFALVKNEIDSYISELGDETDEEDTGGIVLEVQQYIDATITSPGLHDEDFLLGTDSATAVDDINAVNNI